MIDWTQLAISFGYFGVFLLGLIGAASFFIPVPTTVGLLGVAVLRIFDPFLLALAFGLGAGLGQLTSYAVGYAGRTIVDKKHERRLNAMMKIFDRYRMPVVVFVFAATPLPDSILFIPLGLVRYPIWKVFASSTAGKILMSLVITHFGWMIGADWLVTVLSIVLTLLVVVVMLRIDWEKLADKYLSEDSVRAKRGK